MSSTTRLRVCEVLAGHQTGAGGAVQRSEQRETRQLYLRLEGRYTRARCPPSQRWCRDEHMHAPIDSKPKDGVREATNCRDGRTDARTAETDGELLDAKRRHRGNDGTSCGRRASSFDLRGQDVYCRSDLCYTTLH